MADRDRDRTEDGGEQHQRVAQHEPGSELGRDRSNERTRWGRYWYAHKIDRGAGAEHPHGDREDAERILRSARALIDAHHYRP